MRGPLLDLVHGPLARATVGPWGGLQATRGWSITHISSYLAVVLEALRHET
jgi:hypothetical protein